MQKFLFCQWQFHDFQGSLVTGLPPSQLFCSSYAVLFVSASLLCVTAYDRCRTVRPFMIRPSILVYCSRSSIRFSTSVIFTSFSFRRLFSSALSHWRSVTIACFRHLIILSLFSAVSSSFVKCSSSSSMTSDDVLPGFPLGIVTR